MARTVYVTTELTGAGSALDGVNGNALVKGDVAFYINKHTTQAARKPGFVGGIYMASTRGSTVAAGSTEDAPNFIVPDSNGTNWIWGLMQPLMPVFNTTGLTATLPNHGVSVIRTQTPTVHILRPPRRGVVKSLVFSTTGAIKIRMSTAGAGTYTVKMGSSICVIVNASSRALSRLPAAITLAGRTTSRWEVVSLSSPSTGTVKGRLSFSTTT